jgi:trimeric autotransporter adhesin
MPSVRKRVFTPAARRSASRLVAALAAALAACTGAQTDVVTTASVASVSVTPPATTLSVGSQIPLQASVQDAAGKAITGTNVFWSVRDPNIASVSGAGVVTGLTLGSTEVAASSNGKSGIATITVQKTPVASVTVTPPHVDAAPGGRAPFSAVAYDAAQNPLSGRVITWSTSNAAIAVVDTAGFMTAVAPGSATITATSEGKSGTATVTVSQAPVATVAVTPTPLSMSLGQTTQLAVTLKDASGNVLSGRVVTWSSSSPGVGTVSTTGLVTAVAAGATTITATSEGKTGTAAVTISNVAVGSVTVQPQGPSIMQGTSVQLSATVRDVNGVVVTDRVVTWSTSNSAVASVTSAGVVTGVGVGTATITATSEGKFGTTVLNVTPVPVGSVTVLPASPDTAFIGYTTQLSAVTKDSAGGVLTGRTVTWGSNNGAIATVDASGLVTGVAAGSATITATSETKSGTATVVVTKAPVGNIVIAGADSVSSVGSVPFAATVKDVKGAIVTDRTVTWVSTLFSIATVSPSTGATTTVSGKTTGQSLIIGTAETKADTVTMQVVAAVTSVVIAPASKTLSLALSPTVQLTVTCRDASNNIVTGRTIKWTSSNTSVATVDANGLVTAKAAGPAQITATAVYDGVASATPALITVTP